MGLDAGPRPGNEAGSKRFLVAGERLVIRFSAEASPHDTSIKPGEAQQGAIRSFLDKVRKIG